MLCRRVIVKTSLNTCRLHTPKSCPLSGTPAVIQHLSQVGAILLCAPVPHRLRDMKQRIQWLRERAVDIRATAQRLQFAETRGVMFRIAESYENIATHLETTSERLSLPSADWALPDFGSS